MKVATLRIEDQVNVYFDDLDPKTRRDCNTALKFRLPYAHNLPAAKFGGWDGSISYFALNGHTYLNVLDKVVPVLENNGYSFNIIDNRSVNVNEYAFEPIDENFLVDYAPTAVWPKGHPQEGQPIILRDYQVEAINAFLEGKQCLQEISTGAGKCLDKDTEIEVDIDPESDFGKFLLNKLKLTTGDSDEFR